MGCSLHSTPALQYHPRFDFSQIQTYSFYDRNSDFSEIQIVNSGMRNSIELSVEERLNSFGLRYEVPEKADIIVGYFLLSGTQISLKKYNKSVKYCAYCLEFYSGNERIKSWKNKVGSIVIDLVDTKKERSVWRSIYPLNIGLKDSSQKIQARLNTTVSRMFYSNPQHIAGML